MHRSPPPRASRAAPAHEEALITSTAAEGAIVVTVACESLRERQAGELRDRLECIAEDNSWRIALCLAGVSTICSTCLTDLVLIHRRCRARGGALVLFGLRPSLRQVLESTGLFNTLPIADTIPEALIACRRGPEKAGFFDRFRRTRAA